MLRTSTAWAASCAALLLTLSGCRFFGIDNRPDIRYVTEKERKEVKEPMYSMSVPGTRLFKQWPMRHGPDYGYAPWEKKQGVVMANAPGDPATNAAAATGANAENKPAGVAAQNSAATPESNEAAHASPAATTKAAANKAAPNKAMVMAEAAAKSATKPGKPSGRATPRLPGELSEDDAMAAHEAWSGSRVHAGDGAVAVADDFDVPVAARGDLEFRSPGMAAPEQSQPKAANALVARSATTGRTARPPVDKNLAWRDTNEAAEAATAELPAEEMEGDLHVSQDERGATMATASDIGLQQPGGFAARKPVAAKPRTQPKRVAMSNNVLRDEAVRPASATKPITVPKKAPRTVLPAADFTPGDSSSVHEELVPPSEEALSADPLERLPAGMSDEEIIHEEPATTPAMPTRPRLVAPPVRMDHYESGAKRAGAYQPASEPAADEDVFVTASDMSDQLPYGDAAASSAPPYSSSQDGSPIYGREQVSNVAPREYVNPHYEHDAAGDNTDVNDALEAAKRAVLQ
jgi:hypothetical protein